MGSEEVLPKELNSKISTFWSENNRKVEEQ